MIPRVPPLPSLVRKTFARFNSSSTEAATCVKTVFQPTKESAKAVRHLKFTVPISYEKGLKIQESFVSAFLEFKKMARKIDDKRAEMKEKNLVANSYEDQLLQQVLAMKPAPTILTFQFNNIITAGRREKQRLQPQDIDRIEASTGYEFYQADRGGEISFHNVGQLVVYPIIDLKDFSNLTVRCFVNLLEDSVIEALKTYDIAAKKTDNTGVWVDDNNKISSLGLQVRRSVTSHGLSLNVNNEIPPIEQAGYVFCGLNGKSQTSMKLEKGHEFEVNDVATQLVREITKKLNIETIEVIELDDLEL